MATEIEHHPSCKDRCVQECGVSPRHAHRDRDAVRPPRVRTFHVEAVAAPSRESAPLWQYIDDWAAVEWHREQGVEIHIRDSNARRISPDFRTLVGLPLPRPEEYTGQERADPRHSLDAWTADGGVKDRELDSVHRAAATDRKTRALATRDHLEVAAIIHGAFRSIATSTSPAVTKRRPTDRQRALLELVIGEAPPVLSPCAPMHESCEHVRSVFTAIVWGLGLLLFGREKDPVSDHAFGRMLPGEPVRDVRPPFACAAHLLAVADHELQGLGGGGSAWPSEDPRARRRTWALGIEMKVSGARAGSDHIRGEQGVHRILDARNVARRAALTPHERAAVEILNGRELTRDERTMALREVEARRRGIDPATLVTAETARLRILAPLTALADAAEGLAIDAAVLCGENVKARREAHERRMDRLVERESIDAAAGASLLRKATDDVSDRELYRQAKAAEKRVREAAERKSVAGDALTPRRTDRRPVSRRPRVDRTVQAHLPEATA